MINGNYNTNVFNTPRTTIITIYKTGKQIIQALTAWERETK